MTKTKKEEKVLVHVEPELKSRLLNAAEKLDRSASAIVRFGLIAWLNEFEATGREPALGQRIDVINPSSAKSKHEQRSR